MRRCARVGLFRARFLLLPSRGAPTRIWARTCGYRPSAARTALLVEAVHEHALVARGMAADDAHVRRRDPRRLGDQAAQRVVRAPVDGRRGDADHDRPGALTDHFVAPGAWLKSDAQLSSRGREPLPTSRSLRSRTCLRGKFPGRRRSTTVSPPHAGHGSSSRCSTDPANRLHRVSPHVRHRTAYTNQEPSRVEVAECNRAGLREDLHPGGVRIAPTLVEGRVLAMLRIGLRTPEGALPGLLLAVAPVRCPLLTHCTKSICGPGHTRSSGRALRAIKPTRKCPGWDSNPHCPEGPSLLRRFRRPVAAPGRARHRSCARLGAWVLELSLRWNDATFWSRRSSCPRPDELRPDLRCRMIGGRRPSWKLPHSIIQPALPACTGARRCCGCSPTNA